MLTINYYETPGPHNVPAHFGIRTDKYMLVCFYGKQIYWELYDVKKDPDELHNLYTDGRYDALFHKMKGRLRNLIVKYDDEEALEILDHAETK